MTGWHLPGDPYFPVPNGGWLEESDTPPHSPAPPAQHAEVIDLISDDEEEAVMDSAEGTGSTHHSQGAVPDFGSDAANETEPMEEYSASTTDAPPTRAIPRSLHEVRPEPSFRVYRHPGGPLWKYTPRKRVLPTHRTNPLLTLSPFQGPGPQTVPATPPPTRCYHCEHCPRSTRHTDETEERVRMHTSQIYDIGAATQTATARIHALEQELSHTRAIVASLQVDAAAARLNDQAHRAHLNEMRRQVGEATQEVQRLRELYASASGSIPAMVILD